VSDKPLTVAELAALLSVSVDWVYTQVEAGAIPCTRLPSASRTGTRRLIRFTAAHVATILAEGDRPAVIVPAISLARARAIRAGTNPPPAPPTEPRTPVTPPKPSPASPRPPSGPGRAQGAA